MAPGARRGRTRLQALPRPQQRPKVVSVPRVWSLRASWTAWVMLLRPPTALTGLSWLPELGLGPAACRPGDTISESGRPAGPGGQWLSFGGRGAVAAVSCEAETALGRPTFPSGRPAGSSSSRTPPPGGYRAESHRPRGSPSAGTRSHREPAAPPVLNGV